VAVVALCTRSQPQQLSTYALTLFPYEAEVDGRAVPVDFWDTAGQERFNSLHPSYYYQAHACILVGAAWPACLCVRASLSFSSLGSSIERFAAHGGHVPPPPPLSHYFPRRRSMSHGS
jgi:hypothetical protein